MGLRWSCKSEKSVPFDNTMLCQCRHSQARRSVQRERWLRISNDEGACYSRACFVCILVAIHRLNSTSVSTSSSLKENTPEQGTRRSRISPVSGKERSTATSRYREGDTKLADRDASLQMCSFNERCRANEVSKHGRSHIRRTPTTLMADFSVLYNRRTDFARRQTQRSVRRDFDDLGQVNGALPDHKITF